MKSSAAFLLLSLSFACAVPRSSLAGGVDAGGTGGGGTGGGASGGTTGFGEDSENAGTTGFGEDSENAGPTLAGSISPDETTGTLTTR